MYIGMGYTVEGWAVKGCESYTSMRHAIRYLSLQTALPRSQRRG